MSVGIIFDPTNKVSKVTDKCDKVNKSKICGKITPLVVRYMWLRAYIRNDVCIRMYYIVFYNI